MGENSRFDFCPKCGALAKDGICQSCGYQNPEIVPSYGQFSGQMYGQPQGYYGGQQAPQSQSYYGGQPTGQPQGYYGGQSTGQPQGYYGGQLTEQPQGYYGGQPTGQPQGYYGGQPTEQPQGYYGGQPTGQPQGYYGGQPTEQPQGYYGGYAPAVPSEAAGGKSNKVTVAVLCIVLGFVLLAVIVLILVGLYNLQDNGKSDSRSDRDRDREQSEEYTDETVENNQNNPAYNYNYVYLVDDVTADNRKEEGQDASLPYYSGPYNALRDDLSYKISFTREVYYAADAGTNILISVEYPQISSDSIPYVDSLNEFLRDEYVMYYEFFEEEFKPLVRGMEDTYYGAVDSYVTYMDEDILSIVFKETVRVSLENESFVDLDFFCVNIDLHSGVIMDNTVILRVDKDFVATLRDRERLENESLLLDSYTDEKIMDMLKNEYDLVLFYTPMGMEVGLNLTDELTVVYFMYDDYEQYLNMY